MSSISDRSENSRVVKAENVVYPTEYMKRISTTLNKKRFSYTAKWLTHKVSFKNDVIIN